MYYETLAYVGKIVWQQQQIGPPCARRNVLTTQLTANSFCRTLQKIANMYDLLSLTLVSIVYRQYKPQSNSLLHHRILNSGSLCWLTLTGYSRPPVGDIMQHAHCIN